MKSPASEDFKTQHRIRKGGGSVCKAMINQYTTQTRVEQPSLVSFSFSFRSVLEEEEEEEEEEEKKKQESIRRHRRRSRRIHCTPTLHHTTPHYANHTTPLHRRERNIRSIPVTLYKSHNN